MLEVGTVLANSYTVKAFIKREPTGELYELEEMVGRPPMVALLLSPFIVQQAAAIERLRREFATISRLQHPGIARVYESGRDPSGQVFLIRERLLGEPLSKITRAGQELATIRVESIVKQLVQALGAAHASGLVHGNLNPDNIYLQPTPAGDEVKIIGFGVAPTIDALTLNHFGLQHYCFGTPGYVAPEILKGEAPTAASDFYAVGIIAYELLTGRRAFDAGSPLDTFVQQAHGNPPAPGFDVEILAIWKVVENLLEHEALVRYNRASMVLDDMEEATDLDAPEDSTMAIPLGHLFLNVEGAKDLMGGKLGPGLFDGLGIESSAAPPAQQMSLDISMDDVKRSSGIISAVEPPLHASAKPEAARITHTNMPPPGRGPKPIESGGKAKLILLLGIVLLLLLAVLGTLLFLFVL